MARSTLCKVIPAKASLNKQGGFVLTIELILIITILVIGSFVGITAIRDALFKQKIKQQDRSVLVADSNNNVLGEVINFDEHDAPQLLYIDRTTTNPPKNYRALIGVRDDRFTSREPIYYTALNCQGDPCIKPTSNETLDSSGVSRLPNTGAVSYFQALQNGPNYAIGRSPNGLPGFLYKETFEACPMPEIIGGIGSPIGSRYISQKVVTGEPCESPVNLPLDAGQAPLTCSSSDSSIPLSASCDSACGTDSGGQCACPAGYYSVTGGLVDRLGLQGQCCPNGTELEDSSQLGIGVNALCSGLNLKKAVSVPNINDQTQNALEPFIPPFQVNLPALGGRIDGDQWFNTAPNGE
ncbi:hypothetical protein [Psychromonas sp. SP041]|uniref:hypothetical protein n=1 Tax=Psychromonas sp. SP041 TaxID=1365007 RepID=UPI0003F6393A|nr:hypothetical protein [Psychromonas sp. SP041]